MSREIKIGIIGGSGLYAMEELTDTVRIEVDTPFGAPSDAYVTGFLKGISVAFLPRHGRGHRLMPSELNYRANIYGFKKLGVERIISVTAVGSLKENIHPLDILIPDQLYDRTKTRLGTFFGDGLVAHISFSDPICSDLAKLIYAGAGRVNATVRLGGTLLCIDGPAFSTRAEANVYRQWGMDIIGMTSLQEAKLAREAEICYAAVALVTDYDCWHAQADAVSVETVVNNLQKNVSTAQAIIRAVLPTLSQKRSCACTTALKDAIMTAPDAIPLQTRSKLELLVGKYLDLS